MTRLYLKIFVSFWLITIMMIVGTSLVVHWLDLGTDKHLARGYHDENRPPAEMRLLREVVREAINHDIADVKQGLGSLPPWAISHLFIVDNTARDVLGRPLPETVTALLPEISGERPFHQQTFEGKTAFGRYITLEDGHPVKLVAISNPDGENILWQLFFRHVWPTLLVSILISGTACFFLAKRMSRGLATLKRATQRIAGGDLSVRVTPYFQGRRDEIGLLGNEFDHMAERLEKAMLEQKRLIKDVSHELRSPLARLQVALALAQQRSNGTVDQELNRIKAAAEYLNDVISDILSLPLNEKDSWELNDAVDIRTLLDTLITHYRDEAGCKSVRLFLDVAVPEEDTLVHTHGNTLTGVFENILRNAIHYTLPDTPIVVTLNCEGDRYYRVRVVDRGPGVPEKNLEDIFQPFYRADEARDRSSGGYGLGLAIAQRTVALHGGRMCATNDPLGGLVITVILPKGSFD